MSADGATAVWRSELVRPAGGGDRRRASDILRAVGGTLGAAAAFALIRQVPDSDPALTRWAADVGLNQPWVATTGRALLVVVLPLTVILIALATRSWRLLLAAALAGATAAVVVAALAPLTQPASERSELLDSFGITAHFPLIEVAVPVAVLIAAGAFLARPAHRFVGAVVAVGLVASLAGEHALLLDLVASVLAGWAAAGLAGLVFGSPVGDATPAEVGRNLSDLDLVATDVAAIGHPNWGIARFRAQLADLGPVLIDVHGREAQEARLLQRIWRTLVDKGGATHLAIGRREQSEHEALCIELARRAGIPTGALVAVGTAGPTVDGYVVAADAGAVALRDLDPADVDDDLLRAVWASLAACRTARLAHGLADGTAFERRPDGTVQLTDWFVATPSADPAALNRDVATTLLATAAKSNATRAVAAAIAGIGQQAITDALPLCQLSVLDVRARDDVDKGTATSVRAEAAQALGVQPPELASLHRMSKSDLLMVLGTVLGFWLLYSQLASLGDIWSTIADANWAWVAVLVVLAQVSVVYTAVGLRGAVLQPLTLGPMVALEYADLFVGLVGGTVAITATNIRYFQRQGLSATSAVTSGVMSSLAGGVIQAVIVLASLPFLLSSGTLDLGSAGSTDSGGGGGGSVMIKALVVVAAVSGAAMLVPRFRSAVSAKVKPKLDAAWSDVRTIAKRPSKLATMVLGQLASQVLLALALGAALVAYGGSLSFVDLLLINTLAALIGGIAPVPGGMGAVEAGLIGGFTVFGVDATTAGAATFTFRLFTAYLPPAWGWPTLAWMRRRELL